MKVLATIFISAIAFTGMFAQTTTSPDVLLKAAMQREQVDGDLAGAIAQYKAIADKFPKDPAAPAALLRLAEIYQRQGNRAAEREVYERLVREYPNSGGPAAAAQQALLRTVGSEFKQTELVVTGKAAGMLGSGRVSPDGRYVSFADTLVVAAGGTGNLAIWDTKSGMTTIVNKFSNVKPWADGSAEDSAWSPDGRQLAYTWRPTGADRRELRVVDRATGAHRVVYVTRSGGTWVLPMAWSPDAGLIVTALGGGAGEGTVGASELALISVGDGSKRTLRRFDGTWPSNAAFSPDGKFVAYDVQPQNNTPARDVFVVTLDGSHEFAIADDRSAHDVLLGWLPNGHLLFTSDRGGSTDAWAVRVTNSMPTGAPFVVKRDVGQLTPQGVTKNGGVFVQKTVNVEEIYVADLDPATGRVVRPAAPLVRAQPSVARSEPAWSPDGLRIAYVQSAPGVPQSIVVQTMATNEVHVYAVPVRNIDWPLWQRDGRAFIFDGTGEDNVQRTFRLDLNTGRTAPFSDSFVVGMSPDGQFIYLQGAERSLLRRNLADGKTDQIAAGTDAPAGTTLSPDGRWLAYLTGGAGGSPNAVGRSLAIQGTSGGPARVLLENFRSGYPRLTWSPDSRYVIVSVNPGGLHRISIDGGPREPLGIAGLGLITERSMNADGRRLALAVSRTSREFWVWENVLQKGAPR